VYKGVSVSAGIPDYRSVGTGMYSNAEGRNAFDASIFQDNPQLFYDRMQRCFLPVINGAVKPTPAHHFIKLLHDKQMLHRLYTQNVDLLDRIVGIPAEKLVEAHGSLASAYCSDPRCLEEADMQSFWQTVALGDVPRCWKCSSAMRPDIVLFGEALSRSFHEKSDADLPKCDLLIVMGTTLVVYPFAGLLSRVPLLSPRLLLNREPTGPFQNASLQSNYRDVAFIGDCDDGAQQLADALGWGDQLRDQATNANTPLYFGRKFN
jgi:NAD+-dependent protein deacetylase sirtuin 2